MKRLFNKEDETEKRISLLSVQGIVIIALILGLIISAFVGIRPLNVAYQMTKGKIWLNINESKAIDAYWKALQRGHLKAANRMIDHYLENENYDEARMIVDWVRENGGDSAESVLKKYVPEEPHVSVSPGTYNECIEVAFSTEDEYTQLHISENDAGYTEKTDVVYELNQKKNYVFSAYLMNNLGLTGDVYRYEYNMDIPIPQDVQVSLKGGTYDDYQSVTLSSPEGYTIYYTTDGTEPSEDDKIYSAPIAIQDGTVCLQARAVDRNGTWGNCLKETYTIKLPVPESVQFSVPGGVISDEFQLCLEQSEGAKIYYTTDGETPTENSIFYENPIDMNLGSHMISAIAINEFGKTSAVVSQNYQVTYNKYASHPHSARIGDLYYAVLGEDSKLMVVDQNLDIVRSIGIDNVLSVYTDGKQIIFATADTIYRIDDPEYENVTEMVNMEIGELAVAHDQIYFTSSGMLHRMDMNGDNLTVIGQFSNCRITGVQDDQVFFYDTDKQEAYTIEKKDGDVKSVVSGIKEDYIIHADGLYYLENGQLVYRDLNKNKSKVLAKASSTTEITDQFAGREYSETVRVNYDEIASCRDMLYVRATVETISTYKYQGDVKDKSTFSYKWLVIDMKTNKVREANIDSEHICLFDTGIITDNLEKMNVVF